MFLLANASSVYSSSSRCYNTPSIVSGIRQHNVGIPPARYHSHYSKRNTPWWTLSLPSPSLAHQTPTRPSSTLKQPLLLSPHSPIRLYTAAIPGKSANPAQVFFLKYKGAIIGGTIVSTLLFLTGYVLYYYTLKVILGVSLVVITFISWSYLKYKKEMVLLPSLSKEIQKNRKAIEKTIGSFEMPTPSSISVFKKEATVPGKKIPIILHTFGLKGTKGSGMGFMRAVTTSKFNLQTLEWEQEMVVEKFRLELESISYPPLTSTLILVDKHLVNPVYVDTAQIVSRGTEEGTIKEEGKT